jgi:endonuclease/exonuclease/phosphatase family metal-dependent hydrolase
MAAGVHVAVGTFNIHHGVGARRLDLDYTADAIAQADVDVIALQEVDRFWSGRSAFADQAGRLADRLGMHMAFGPSLERGGRTPAQPPGQYGCALLSRYPVLDSRSTLLPRPRRGEQRSLLDADVAVSGLALRCLATHLQNRSRTERLAQARAISATIAQRSVPTVLLGDLNAPPGSPEIEVLSEHLVDTWRSRGDGEGCTFSAKAPSVRIDYVLASPDIEVEAVRVVETDASDHLPVVAGLRLGARAARRRDPTA